MVGKREWYAMKYTCISMRDSLFRQYRGLGERTHESVARGIPRGSMRPWTPDVDYLVNAIKQDGLPFYDSYRSHYER